MQRLLMEPVFTGNLHQPADGYSTHQVVDVVLVVSGTVVFQAQWVWPDLGLYCRELPGRRAVSPQFQYSYHLKRTVGIKISVMLPCLHLKSTWTSLRASWSGSSQVAVSAALGRANSVRFNTVCGYTGSKNSSQERSALLEQERLAP